MKTKLYALILLALTLAGSGFAQASKPLPERQQEFLSWKFGMFIHYGVASYNEGQWATGYEDPGTFAPTQLDCGQWANAAKAAGMKYAVFTTKHTSGYALWDSKHTTHDITAFKNFKDGKGDLVREFVDAFRARGIKIGLYYCLPGDYSKNKLQPGQTDLHGLPPEATGDYAKFIKLQLTELLTQYGVVDLMWFDQYNNKYTRAQWGEIKAHVHSLQPDCLVLANNSTDFKKTDIHSYEYPWLKAKKGKALPSEGNTNVAEVCDCITPGAWFWQANLTEKSVTSTAKVVEMLKLCNSRQANYLLNVPPDRTGRIPEWLVRRLEEIGQEWEATKPVTPLQCLQRAMKELDAAKTPENRFYALNDAAKASFVAGKTDDAQKYAQELMSLLPQFQGNWNYGNAIADANQVLGQIALSKGDVREAKKHLLASAASKGSPQLDSFGPSFILARELAEKGERETVIAFLDSVARFWANPDDRTEPNSKSIASEHLKQLESWKEQLRAGKVPDHPKWR